MSRPVTKKKLFKITKQQKAWFIVGIVLFVVMIGLISFSERTSSWKKDLFVKKVTEPIDCEFHSILNGVCVESAVAQTPAIVAVMIENHPASRPQAGLAEASVVYEAVVEGNYTRFLALYPYTMRAEKVGPVRSARPYYLDWIAEYDNPLYMHVGGSPEALKIVSVRKIWDANEMYAGNYFWRATNRTAPHNTYTNSELWTKKIGQETENKFIGWDFSTSSVACVVHCVDFIEIPYLRPDFITGWKYNSSTQNYERWQDGAPHQTETGTIHADTLAIMEVPVKVLDDIGRVEMKTIGAGPAIVVVNGRRIMGTWQKSAVSERTNWFDETGKEINFKPGKIWIQVVPRLSMVIFTEL